MWHSTCIISHSLCVVLHPLCIISHNITCRGYLAKRALYLTCVSMAGRALLAGYPRCIISRSFSIMFHPICIIYRIVSVSSHHVNSTSIISRSSSILLHRRYALSPSLCIVLLCGIPHLPYQTVFVYPSPYQAIFVSYQFVSVHAYHITQVMNRVVTVESYLYQITRCLYPVRTCIPHVSYHKFSQSWYTLCLSHHAASASRD